MGQTDEWNDKTLWTDPEGDTADGEDCEVSEVGKLLNPLFERIVVAPP